MVYMILDIKWLLSYSHSSAKYTLNFVKIFSTLGAPEVIWFSSTPSFFTEEEKPKDLECTFSGWPLEIHWYKDDKIITNGTEGVYHTEDKRRKNGEETLHSTLSLPPGREEVKGIYKCSAKNRISGWQTSQSFEYRYECKQKHITT